MAGKARGKLSGAALAEFNAKHPRGAGGRFGSKGGAAALLSGTPAAPSSKTKAPAKADAPKKARNLLSSSSGDVSTVVAQLEELGRRPKAGDDDKALALLGGLSSAQLTEVAEQKGWGRTIKGSAKNKRERLADAFVGARLQFGAQMTGVAADGKGVDVRPWDNPDGLDKLQDHQLRSMADEFEVPRGSREDMLAGLRAQGAVSPQVRRDREEAEVATTPERMQADVTRVYDELAATWNNEWVTLDQLRQRLGGTRQEQDAALKKLVTDRKVRLIPEENQKTLTPAERDAALDLGGEDKHLIGIPAEWRGNSKPAAAPKKSTARARLAANNANPFNPLGDSPARVRADAIAMIVAEPEATAREDLRKQLEGLTLAQLQEVLDTHSPGTKLSAISVGVTKKDQKIGRMVEHLVGHRMNARTIERGGFSPDLREATPATSAPKKSARGLLSGGGGPKGGSRVSTEAARLRAEADQLGAARDNLANLRDSSAASNQARDLRRRADALDAEERARQSGKPIRARSDEELGGEISDVYAQLASKPNDLVSLVKLRGSLPDVPRDQFDRVLKALDRARVISLDPDPNRKALPREAHDAAISLGGEDKHFISMRNLRPQPGQPKPSARQRLSGRRGTDIADLNAQFDRIRAQDRIQPGDRDTVQALLAPLTVAELNQLAATRGWANSMYGSKATRQRILLDLLVGNRATAQTIMDRR